MIKAPGILRLFYPGLLWKKSTEEKSIYLTFDDGPVPGPTEFVLEELEKANVKATFFCVGENIVKYPEIFMKIAAGGHRLGNHTFNHLNGWKTNDTEYFQNIHRCEKAIFEISRDHAQGKKLFRPPYGRIKRSQVRQLMANYQIVMWDVLTKDYALGKPADICLRESIRFASPGSIVVFHDRIKNEERLRYMLPRFLEHFAEAGYSFKAL